MRGSSVAVIGSGVSGLTAAYILQRQRRVTLFEASSRLGGDADTVTVRGDDGAEVTLDLAFMVFNRTNYPRLVRLFDELGVLSRPSEMSISMSCDGCGLSFLCGSPFRGLPVKAAGWPRRRWEQAVERVREVAARAGSLPADGGTLGDLLSEASCPDDVAQHLLLPLVSAIWSCGIAEAKEFPAAHLFTFLRGHGLMPDSETMRWRTVVGGSREYVRRIASRLNTVCRDTPIRSVRRTGSGVEIRDAADDVHVFDAAVIATHPDQALRMLLEPAARQRAVLAAIQYTRNEAVLHTDAAILPADPGNHAAWNHRRSGCGPAAPVTVSYHLNKLQGIDGPIRYLVTLNPAERIPEEAALVRRVYAHPLYTAASTAAAGQAACLSDRHIAFAGAYQGWGFHEDGCLSGVRAAQALGVSW